MKQHARRTAPRGTGNNANAYSRIVISSLRLGCVWATRCRTHAGCARLTAELTCCLPPRTRRGGRVRVLMACSHVRWSRDGREMGARWGTRARLFDGALQPLCAARSRHAPYTVCCERRNFRTRHKAVGPGAAARTPDPSRHTTVPTGARARPDTVPASGAAQLRRFPCQANRGRQHGYHEARVMATQDQCASTHVACARGQPSPARGRAAVRYSRNRQAAASHVAAATCRRAQHRAHTWSARSHRLQQNQNQLSCPIVPPRKQRPRSRTAPGYHTTSCLTST